MKKVLFFLIIVSTFFQVPQIFTEETTGAQEIVIRAELIQKYIKQHKDNINKFIIEYNITNNIPLDRKLEELNTFSVLIYKIQIWQIQWTEAKRNINQILSAIKRINEEFKILLKKEKELFERNFQKRKLLYSEIWKKLAQKLDQINIQIATKIFKGKTQLSEREKQLKRHLLELNKESIKLKNIHNINFQSEQEIQQAFIRILKNIRREMLWIKATIELPPKK